GVYDDNPALRKFANQIWTSDDCITWVREKDVPFTARQYSDMVEWDNKLWIWAGDRAAQTGSGSLNLKDLWYMDENGKWHQKGSIPIPVRHATGVAVDKKNDHLVFACGNLHSDVWFLEKVPIPKLLDAQNQKVYLDTNCAFVVPDVLESIKDNFPDSVNLSQNPSAGSLISYTPGQLYKVQVTADLGNGNLQNNSLYLNVLDTTAPVLGPLPDIVKTNDSSHCDILVEVAVPRAHDNCGNATVTGLRGDSLSFNSPFPVGNTIITWNAIDDYGNSKPYYQNVIVQDSEPPALTIPQNIMTCNLPDSNYSIPQLTATDNCSVDSIKYEITGVTKRTGNGPDASGNFNVGISTIKWIVSDIHGNVKTGQTNINIESSSLQVSIPSAYALPKGVTGNSLYIGYGPSSLTLSANAQGGSLPYKYSWSTGDTSDSIQVNQQAVGSYTYKVTVTDGAGCAHDALAKVQMIDVRCGSNLDKISVCKIDGGAVTTECADKNSVGALLAQQCYLGICANNIDSIVNLIPPADIQDLMQVIVMPNPTSSYFSIKLESFSQNPMGIRVFNSLGAQIEEKYNLVPGTQIQIGERYQSGMYLLEVIQNYQRLTFKLVKN
ncbi:MAG TPA: T9SS type A sorting domain-containing protein, partial [Chitinophagaceae bacterium]